jgi:hypothetical protein
MTTFALGLAHQATQPGFVIGPVQRWREWCTLRREERLRTATAQSEIHELYVAKRTNDDWTESASPVPTTGAVAALRPSAVEHVGTHGGRLPGPLVPSVPRDDAVAVRWDVWLDAVALRLDEIDVAIDDLRVRTRLAFT